VRIHFPLSLVQDSEVKALRIVFGLDGSRSFKHAAYPRAKTYDKTYD
jgi:hypothetical protein